MNVIEMPRASVADVVEGLRALADKLESDEVVAHNLAWIIDKGDGVIDIGLLGQSPQPATTAYFLMGLGKRRLEDSV